jgi:hypothetical protein
MTRRRRNTLDYAFFDMIDTEHKAYILGLLYADGCNLSYRVTLQLIDRELIEKVCDAMGANRSSIRFRAAAFSTRSDSYTINLFSRHLCEQLTQKGCGPKKTMKLIFPGPDIVPTHLLRHFVRGHFDGDGSVYSQIVRGTYTYLNVSIVGNIEFLTQLSILIQPQPKIWTQRGKIPDLKIESRAGVKWFRDWVYQDATIWMERKRTRFDDTATLVNPSEPRPPRKPRIINLTKEHKKIIATYNSGVSTRDTAKLHNVSKSTMHDILKRHQITTRKYTKHRLSKAA